MRNSKNDYDIFFEMYQNIFSCEIVDSFDPWFKSYCGKLKNKTNCDGILFKADYLLKCAKINTANKKLLDAGSGFGPLSLAFYILGIPKIHAIDIYQPMVETFKKIIDFLDLKNNVFTVVCDVAKTSYKDNFFDIIVSNESISHYLDVPGFIQESHRILKKGGILIISDYNNGANPKVRRRNYEIWNAFENGPPTDNIHGHQVEKPYIDIRKEIVEQHFPHLNKGEIEMIAKGTSFMTKDEVVNAAKRYVERKIKPTSFYDRRKCPIHPLVNQYIEALFNPYELKKDLEKFGFKVKVFALVFGLHRNFFQKQFCKFIRFISRLFPFTNIVLIKYTPAFIIVASKR